MKRLEEEWDVANAQLQTMVPDTLKRRKFWKRAPKNMDGVTAIEEVAGAETDSRS
jgi:hypothetical protein